MTLFCFLWIPLFYLFRRSTGESAYSGGVWALILGSVVALVKFFLGDLVDPGGFGVSRWVSALIDIVALPALLPLAVYFFFAFFKIFSEATNYADFALLWLIPGAGIRAVGWSASSDPSLLVLVPVLWTTIAVGIPLFIGFIMTNPRWYVRVPSALAIVCLPFLAATAWWAFYSQKTAPGFLFLCAAGVPMLVSVIRSFIKPGSVL